MLVMSGTMPDDFDIRKQPLIYGEPGYVQWFDALPDDLLTVQNCYHEQWHIIKTKLKGKFQYGNLEE